MATLNPLVSAEWLHERLSDCGLRVADCRFYLAEPERGRNEYLAGHIPGARYFSLDDHLTGTTGPGRHPLPDATTFAEIMGRRGLDRDSTVVVYDDAGGGIAARMWWMLRSLGHGAVYVLDGGWKIWVEESRPATTSIPPEDPTVFSGAATWTGTITAEQIETDRDNLLLIDARAPERFRGDEEPIDPVAGHIPGAVNIPYAGNVESSGRFLRREILDERFATGDVTKTVVSYCGSGVTACNNLLALAAVGRTEALLYPGSWSDWGTSGRPVATSL